MAIFIKKMSKHGLLLGQIGMKKVENLEFYIIPVCIIIREVISL